MAVPVLVPVHALLISATAVLLHPVQSEEVSLPFPHWSGGVVPVEDEWIKIYTLYAKGMTAGKLGLPVPGRGPLSNILSLATGQLAQTPASNSPSYGVPCSPLLARLWLWGGTGLRLFIYDWNVRRRGDPFFRLIFCCAPFLFDPFWTNSITINLIHHREQVLFSPDYQSVSPSINAFRPSAELFDLRDRLSFLCHQSNTGDPTAQLQMPDIISCPMHPPSMLASACMPQIFRPCNPV